MQKAEKKSVFTTRKMTVDVGTIFIEKMGSETHCYFFQLLEKKMQKYTTTS